MKKYMISLAIILILVMTFIFTKKYIIVSSSVVEDTNSFSAEDVEKDERLPDECLLDKFALDISGWTAENGWDYNHGNVTSATNQEKCEITHGESGTVQVSLDYSGNGDSSWSEAKIKGVLETPVDISEYNQVVVDVKAPEEFYNFRIKVFATEATSGNVIIDATAAPDQFEIIDGMIQTEVKINFLSGQCDLKELTIGIVSEQNGFKGFFEIERVSLCYGEVEGSVDITTKAEPQTINQIHMNTKDVCLVNENSNENTKVLRAYLDALEKNELVLFGHQNDVHKCVYTLGESKSDVKELVGSYAGMVGIDTLSLTGLEVGMADEKAAVKESVKISKKAVDEGAILTLSMHMPNFTDQRFLQEEGTFDFSTAGFQDAKNLEGNCAKDILPDGKYNSAYVAYLDLIVEYAKGLEGIPVLFRPLHEGNGSWFWWGTATSDDIYIELFQYTVKYLMENGVENFLYVYSPNGPFGSENEYLKRYPGDEYVDVVAFDYYDDYNDLDAQYRDSFFKTLQSTCEVVQHIALEHHKLAAISETGTRVMKINGNQNGLKKFDNPVTGHNWYMKVNNIAARTNMAYFLVWSNDGMDNFYVPYKVSETTGHEMVNEFIEFYNEDCTIFANDTIQMLDTTIEKE